MSDNEMSLTLRIGQKLFDSFSKITQIYAFDHGEDEHEPNTVKLRVPSLCQTNTHCCGAIAAWTVYEGFFGKMAKPFGPFYDRCNPSPSEGMSEGEIARALRHYGIHSRTLRNVDFPTIVKWIDKGRPLIVGVGREEFEDGDHWVVLYGYGVKPNRVFIANQPSLFKSRECFTWGDFRRREWAPAGRALLCYRPRHSLSFVTPP